MPHYFGPYPNWANSPQVLSDAIVTITNGGGTGAEARATVDPKTGGITAVTVVSPGSGYTSAPDVAVTAAGVTPTPAQATAVISLGVVKSIAVDEAGFGFVAPAVTITGGNPTPGSEATAVASGGVDDLTLTDGGSGYTTQPVVEFSLPDLPSGTPATGTATMDAAGVVNGVTVVTPGTGYTSAPRVTILDANQVNPTAATVKATLGIAQIDVTDGGQGYDSAPTVTINDTVGVADKGASATATVAVKGAVTDINVTAPGAGYLTPGLKKFVDTLPGLGPNAANDLGQYIPVAVPDTTTYPGTDYYEIAVVQYRMKFHRDLPATLLRGYVQLSTSVVPGKQIALSNANLDPAIADTPITAYKGVDNPHYLGPTIVANKNRPTRILFRDLLPTGVAGNLFLPVDTSLMGSGVGPDGVTLGANGVPNDQAQDQGSVTDGVRNPACADIPKPAGKCYSENRATLHLHGGITPWISDGTPHQWVTPDGENTAYPKGVSVSNVPDMPDPGPGAETFFYTNQQSARLMFYHDHAWGITRLNVYAGEAAGYLLTDPMEQSLIAPGGALAGLGLGDPLIVQDKSFVPSAAQMAKVDPTWDAAKWGGEGSLWTPHVYMPAQNPGSPSGMSPFGRWMYGPWFWPPAKDAKYPPIANPYYDSACDADVQPFCEPAQIPSTPNVSVGMEAFNDTPIVNGTAYPTTTVDPKSYRYRILNAANDRFWNLSWYVADSTGTEVALKKAEVDAAQTDPVVFPTPDTAQSPKGPSWVQIGTEGGFLPAPTVVPAQETTWITDPTRFDVGNVDKHSLLLAPAERADVIVDFSQYRGKTLILYNDAPAAFPARVPGYDYFTGGADLTPSGAPPTLPGYGPNTRTVMQVKVSTAAPAIAFDRPNTTSDRMGALVTAFAHHADGSGVFESGSDPVIVGQDAYDSAYGTNFVANGYCNSPTNPTAKCDGFARIAEQGGDQFKFDTLGPNKDGTGTQLSIPLQGKGIHDEMNSANFDEWGRMTANMGLEAPGATPLLQNIILYPYVNPATETLDSTGLPGSLDVTPISSAADGTQIWKITHNGVDTHPLHFHLYDVQVINRVTWDNIIIPPEPSELGWKDTVRVSPLEDTIVAVRPIVPTLPFGVPDSHRPLNPMMPIGAKGSLNGPNGTEAGFNNTDAGGNPIAPIENVVANFGWEYVWHCHILSHEEMDMMRPVTVHVSRALPAAPVLSFTRGSTDLSWTDGTPVDYTKPATWTNPGTAEVGYRVERAEVTDGVPGAYTKIADAVANATAYTDNPADPTLTYNYRVTAWNAAGDAASNVVTVEGLPKAPTGLTAVVQPAPQLPAGSQVAVSWVNNASNAVSVVVERAVGTGTFSVLATVAPTDTGYIDTTVVPGTYHYRVKAVNPIASSAYAGPASVDVPQPGSTSVLLNAPNPSSVGQDVTFTATVSPLLASGLPTGDVTFTVNGTTTKVALDVTGVATYTTNSLPAGSHTVTADYSGDSVFLASSASTTQTVNKTATTTVVVSSINPSISGGPVTFTATVTPSTATGTVQFTIDGVGAGAPVPLIGGSATYSTSGLAVGAHLVSATYGGDPAYLASSSTPLTQSVGPALRATSTVVTSNRTPASTFGQNVTFTATVRPLSGTGIPTGSVQFSIDGANVGGVLTLSAQGRATYSTATLSAGSHNVIATYSGSTVFAGGGSATVTQVVAQAASATVVTTSRTPSVSGQTVTFTARVTPLAAAGAVQFRLDGADVGGPVATDATGRARLVISTLPVGAHTVSAAYSGNVNYLPSTSAVLTQTVNKAASRTVVQSSGSPATRGTTVVFTATVTAVAPGAGIPTGTVQFRIDGRAVGTPASINVAGQAAYATSTMTVGNHTVSAVFSGNGAFNPSTSANITQRVR
ncbi:Ig-like domain repeat protein [Kribbella voronezhensis]|uniref:Ig-like domain repeat protein n=1 Tax=Kribbella voronezhensis TaxID=2512212 RepID=UPI00106362F4|nr:Ig-like domain repeat protein [Kribbella voronezhensis]